MYFYQSVFIIITCILLTRIIMSVLPNFQRTNEKDVILFDNMVIYLVSVFVAGIIKIISLLIQG